MAYPIRHLEAVLLANLATFVDHQEVVNLLETHLPERVSHYRSAPEELVALVTLLRTLVAERVPVRAFTDIVQEIERQKA